MSEIKQARIKMRYTMLSLETKANYQTDWDDIGKAELYLNINNCERAVIIDTKENKIVRLFNIRQQSLSGLPETASPKLPTAISDKLKRCRILQN